MNRWSRAATRGFSALSAAVLTAATPLLLVPTGATAQGIVREAPADVKPAMLAVVTPPAIKLDGKPEYLSPGARIRDINNMLVMSATLVGRSLPVVYRREPGGQVHEIWLLTQSEYEKLGGVRLGDPEGIRRFNELLALIFAARTGR